MEHVGTRTLETARLILRRFEAEDAPHMFANWAGDPEVTKYMMWQTHGSVEDSCAIIESWLPHYENNDYYHWAIVLKDYREPIGSISVVHKNDNIQMVHIGYCIGRRWWRMGIMSEALAELIRFFFDEVGVNRIEARHDPRNENSGKVMIKCGMAYEGTSRQCDRSNQGLCDSAHYAILASDYPKIRDAAVAT